MNSTFLYAGEVISTHFHSENKRPGFHYHPTLTIMNSGE